MVDKFDLIISKSNEVYLKIECEPHIEYERRDHFKFEVPNAKFMPQYRGRNWNGEIHLFDMRTKQLYVGLLDRLISFCKNGYLVEDIYNNKLNKCVLFNPNKITDINYSEGSHTLFQNNLDSILYYNKDNYELKLLHFKYLTLKCTLSRKNELCKRLSNTNKSNKWGWHYCINDEKWIERFNNAKEKSINIFELK